MSRVVPFWLKIVKQQEMSTTFTSRKCTPFRQHMSLQPKLVKVGNILSWIWVWRRKVVILFQALYSRSHKDRLSTWMCHIYTCYHNWSTWEIFPVKVLYILIQHIWLLQKLVKEGHILNQHICLLPKLVENNLSQHISLLPKLVKVGHILSQYICLLPKLVKVGNILSYHICVLPKLVKVANILLATCNHGHHYTFNTKSMSLSLRCHFLLYTELEVCKAANKETFSWHYNNF